jgi:hypothetical protein
MTAREEKENWAPEAQCVEPDVDCERRIRRLVERCIAPPGHISPDFPLLNVRDSQWLLRQLDRARLKEIP